MSKKAQAKGKKAGAKDGKDEEPVAYLQAVILTDSYETRFHPFTLEKPRCLLPLANTPMIEYTLEFLANAGVDDLFVYCGNHTDQVSDYLNTSKWRPGSSASPFRHLRIVRSTSASIGDAMRDLDSRNLITGDFLIVSGDIVCNYPLEYALVQHRARRDANKNAIMTMVLREAGPQHRVQAQIVKPVFVLDPANDRCLHYEEMNPLQDNKYANIESDFFKDHDEIEIRSDLIDCHIDICTPDVLALWTDSFDYESPRKHFLFGVLKDHELNGKTVHTHVLREHYAARVRGLQAYDAISRDLTERWAFPLCPETNLLTHQNYRHERGNVYREDHVRLGRTTRIDHQVMIGRDTTIEEGSSIKNSFLGRRCKIGRNVVLNGAYLWDDVTVGDDSNIQQAMLANDTIIGKRCKVLPGALLSFGVQIGDGITIEPSKRITKFKLRKSSDFEENTETVLVGQDGHGFSYESDSETENIEKATTAMFYNMSDLAVSESSISSINSDSEMEVESRPRPASGSFGGSFSGEADHVDDFHTELSTAVFDSLQKGDEATIISLELQSLRLSNNASYQQVRRAVSAAFIRRIVYLIDSESQRTVTAVELALRSHKQIFDNMIFDQDAASKTDQVDLLLVLQRLLARRGNGGAILLQIAQILYDMEVIMEDGFNQWGEDKRSTGNKELAEVRKPTEQFIQWLAQEESEEEEEEEEDDDNDEEEDDES
ncbi:MAG: hypothetical protein M1814_005740 [Vezdaea aestivalis]|nr:MAG: hypothetical protein M1814_005740 [Vezdaea aestivalis]